MRKFYIFLFCLLFSVRAFAGGDDVKIFSLYPVPLKTNRLFVHFNLTTPTVSSVELRNLIGKKIQEKKCHAEIHDLVFEDMNLNPNGIYIVLAKDAQGKVIEILKFIINK